MATLKPILSQEVRQITELQSTHMVDNADLWGSIGQVNWLLTGGKSFYSVKYIDTPANFRLVIRSLQVITDANNVFMMQYSLPWSAATQLMKGRQYLSIESANTVKVGSFSLPSPLVLPPNTRLQIYIAATSQSAADAINFSLNGQVEVQQVDADYSCANQAVIYGDSITWTLAGSSSLPGASGYATLHFEYCWYKLLDYLQGSYGKINKQWGSYGGSTSRTMMYTMRNSGGAMAGNFAIVSVGMNDCPSGAGITTTEYVSNVKEIIRMIRVKTPDCVVLLVAPSPTNDPLRTPYIASYRTALQTMFTSDYGGSMINAGGGSNVNGYSLANKMLFVSMANAFPVASTSDYYSDYTAGYPSNTAIHPNAAGHLAMYNLVTPLLDAAIGAGLRIF